MVMTWNQQTECVRRKGSSIICWQYSCLFITGYMSIQTFNLICNYTDSRSIPSIPLQENEICIWRIIFWFSSQIWPSITQVIWISFLRDFGSYSFKFSSLTINIKFTSIHWIYTSEIVQYKNISIHGKYKKKVWLQFFLTWNTFFQQNIYTYSFWRQWMFWSMDVNPVTARSNDLVPE